MKIDRLGNAKKNIKIGLVFNGLTVLSPFILRLIIIRTIGVEYVGLSGLFSSILNVLNLAELGIGSAIVYSMYEPVAKENAEKTGAILKLYRDVYRVLALVVLIMGIVVMPFLPQLIKGECPSNINIYLLYLIYLFNSLAVYIFGAYRVSLFSAYQREDVKDKVSLYVRLVIYALQFIILVFLKDYYLYAAAIAIGSVLINVILSRKSKIYYPRIIEEGSLSKSEIKEITKGVGGLFINKIASTIRGSFDTIFLTMYNGLVEGGKYSNYYYILMALNGILLVFIQSIRAGIGNSLILQGEKENYDDYMTLQFAYMSMSSVAMILFATICQPFVRICFGSKLLLSQWTFGLVVTYLYVLKIIDVNNVFIDASGIWWKNKWAIILEAGLNFVLDMVLGKHFGLFGIILATVVSIYICQFWMKTCICFRNLFPHKNVVKYTLWQHLIGIVVLISLLFGNALVKAMPINDYYVNAVVRSVLSCLLWGVLFIAIFRQNRYFDKAFRKAIEMIIKR